MNDLIKAILRIAKENPRGFTITIPDLEPVTKGWAIGHTETFNSFGRKGLVKVIQHSLVTTKVVGGWKGYNQKFYFDTVIIEMDIRKAHDLKVEHRQIAIYQIETGRTL